MNPITQIEQLLIYDPDQSRSTVHVFVSHPTPVEETTLGKLVLLAELESQEPINRDIIHAIQKELQTVYYSSEELHPEVALENALGQTNQKISDLVADYATNWHEHLNIVACVIHGEHVYFSEYGKVHVFLIQQQRIIDILASNPSARETSGALKIFSNVVSGRVQTGESMLLTTTSLMDYFSQEKLRRLIAEQPIHDAVGNIENILSENVNNAAFGAIIIQPAKQAAKAAAFSDMPLTITRPQHSATQSSMDKMITQEQQTSELLSPSIMANAKKRFGETTGRFSRFINTKVLRRSRRRVQMMEQTKDYGEPYSTKITSEKPGFISRIWKVIRAIAGFIFSLIAGIISLFANKENRQKIASTPHTIGNAPSRFIVWIKRLPRQGKIILGLAAIIIFIFTQSVVSRGLADMKETKEINYDETVTTIENLLFDAENAFSYDNYSGATDALIQAETLLNDLPTKSDEQQEQINSFSSKLGLLREEARRITRIDNPTLLADLSQSAPGMTIGGIELIGDFIYAFSPQDNSTYSIDTESGDTTLFATAVIDNAFQYATSPTTNTLLFLNTANSLNEYTLSAKALADIPLAFSEQEINVVDIFHYEGRLYMLDIANNQIWRAVRGGSRYASPGTWVTQDGVNLQNGRSLAVDGEIYVLSSTGEVIKMSKGGQDVFALGSVDPALTSGTKIWTDLNSERLYILDASGQRIIVFSKEGSFIDQYMSDPFTNMTDFAIDESRNTVYILTGSKVYSFPLN
ncbi:hypothetical protein ACFL0L_02500 [Patescibacteria group bacterium]